MTIYHIRVQDHLADRYSAWFDPLTITREPSGETLLAGELTDQGALFGVLLKIRDLGLPLLGVAEVQDGRLVMIHQETGDSAAEKFFDAEQVETNEAALAESIPTGDQPSTRESVRSQHGR